MFFAPVSSKAGKLGLTALVAFLSVLGGFYYTAYLFPHRASDAGRTEVSQPVYTRANEQGRAKAEDQTTETETRAEATGPIKLKALEAEREMQLASARQKLCLSMAQKNYEVTWAVNCKTISEQDRKRYERCVAQVDTKAVCAPLARSPSDTCALPPELASKLNKELEELKCISRNLIWQWRLVERSGFAVRCR